MQEKQMKIPFASSLFNLTEINPSFDRGVIRVAYTGKNRNNTFLSKDTFEQCMDSIYNIPVVAYYSREDDSITGHEFDMVKKDGEYQLIPVTQPVGVVPKDANYYWEVVEDKTGIHEYLNVEVLIWKRQECYDKIRRDGCEGQSMEITVKSGEMQDGCYHINDFYYTALCLLGEGHEPCFESAGLTLYQKSHYNEEWEKLKEDFKKEFSNLNTKEDQPMDDNGIRTNENPEVMEPETTPESAPAEPNAEFALNLNEFMSEIHNTLAEIKYTDRWGETCNRYWFVDMQGQEVIVCDCQEHYHNYGVPVVQNGDKVTLDFANCKRKKIRYEDYVDGEEIPETNVFETIMTESMETMYNAKTEAEAKVGKLTEDYEALKAQADETQTKYQALYTAEQERIAAEVKAQKEAVFEQFENELKGEAEYEALKADMDNMEVQDIETQCYALFGKKKAAALFTAKQNKKSTINVGEPEGNEPPKQGAYGGLFNFMKK